MVKACIEHKSGDDRQTDRQTDRQEVERFRGGLETCCSFAACLDVADNCLVLFHKNYCTSNKLFRLVADVQ